jgi:hypothetical protein
MFEMIIEPPSHKEVTELRCREGISTKHLASEGWLTCKTTKVFSVKFFCGVEKYEAVYYIFTDVTKDILSVQKIEVKDYEKRFCSPH